MSMSMPMNAVELVETAMKAWEANDTGRLASCLSDDFSIVGPMPQRMNKEQFLELMHALLTAFPDWSFNYFNMQEHGNVVQVSTLVTGTHTGELVLPLMGVILPTGQKIALPEEYVEHTVIGNKITAIDTGHTPGGGVPGILAQLGMSLPR